MPGVSKIFCAESANCVNTKVARTRKVLSSQISKLTARRLEWPNFRQMVQAQKFEVANCMTDAKRGAVLGMNTPTLYIICW